MLSGAVVCVAAGLGACQTDYSADIHNTTSAPVFAQMMARAHGRDDPPVLGAVKRLGPGDRAFIGPVRASDRAGMVYVTIDSLPASNRPTVLDLHPGLNALDVVDENGMLRVMPKP
jgi:hypothetical protein